MGSWPADLKTNISINTTGWSKVQLTIRVWVCVSVWVYVCWSFRNWRFTRAACKEFEFEFEFWFWVLVCASDTVAYIERTHFKMLLSTVGKGFYLLAYKPQIAKMPRWQRTQKPKTQKQPHITHINISCLDFQFLHEQPWFRSLSFDLFVSFFRMRNHLISNVLFMRTIIVLDCPYTIPTYIHIVI